MTTVLQDDFNRANSTTVPGTPVVGGPYTVRTGTWGINGNALYTSASVANSEITAPASADVDASCTFAILGSSSSGFLFRWSSVNDFWYAGASGNSIILQRRIAGTGINLITIPTSAPPSGLVTRVLANGSKISLFVNGVYCNTIDDPFNQTAAVVGFWISSSTGVRLDDVLVTDTPPTDPTGLDGITSEYYDLETYEYSSYQPIDSFLYKGRDLSTDDAGAEA